MEQVNHPQHYNAREDGLECIDIIRHYVFDIGCAIKYLWRAGQKDGNSERQDLEKALWYVNDQLYAGTELDQFAGMMRDDDPGDIQDRVLHQTGRHISDITMPYPPEISAAMQFLLHVGLIVDGYVYRAKPAVAYLRLAAKKIEERIKELNGEATTD